MKMKKITTVFFTFLMALSLTACAGNNGPGEASSSGPESSPASGTSAAELELHSSETAMENAETELSQEAPAETAEGTGGSKVLVAFFSATNTTQGIAEQIAQGTGADVYEIVPEEPYTDADLNYNDDNSRTTIEMNDPSARPAISGSVENMDQYEIVFLGYPIWWGQAPKVIYTFLESCDFGDATIVPFCTSGSSGIGSSADGLQELTENARWLDGQRFSGSASQNTAASWVQGLDLPESSPV